MCECEKERITTRPDRGEERRHGFEQHRQRCSARAGACVCNRREDVYPQQDMTVSVNAARHSTVHGGTCAVHPAWQTTNHHSTCNTAVFTAKWRRGSPWWRRRPRLTSHARCRERGRATAQGQGSAVVALLAAGPEACLGLHPSRGRTTSTEAL